MFARVCIECVLIRVLEACAKHLLTRLHISSMFTRALVLFFLIYTINQCENKVYLLIHMYTICECLFKNACADSYIHDLTVIVHICTSLIRMYTCTNACM